MKLAALVLAVWLLSGVAVAFLHYLIRPPKMRGED